MQTPYDRIKYLIWKYEKQFPRNSDFYISKYISFFEDIAESYELNDYQKEEGLRIIKIGQPEGLFDISNYTVEQVLHAISVYLVLKSKQTNPFLNRKKILRQVDLNGRKYRFILRKANNLGLLTPFQFDAFNMKSNGYNLKFTFIKQPNIKRPKNIQGKHGKLSFNDGVLLSIIKDKSVTIYQTLENSKFNQYLTIPTAERKRRCEECNSDNIRYHDKRDEYSCGACGLVL